MKLLGDRDEGDLVLVKDLHDASKIEQGATEAIDFVGQHAIHLTGDDILEKLLEGGPVQIRAAKAAVIVALGQTQPALVLLAGDVGLRRFPLRIQGVEFLVQAFLGGLTGVDGTTHHLGNSNAVADRVHEAAPFGSRRKNRWPLLLRIPGCTVQIANWGYV